MFRGVLAIQGILTEGELSFPVIIVDARNIRLNIYFLKYHSWKWIYKNRQIDNIWEWEVKAKTVD